MITIFWILVLLIFYCYFGYPLLLWLTARLRPHPVRKSPQEPAVSVILSVWNEEDVIKEKLLNLLSLDYPPDKMEVLIGSDGSTDRTNHLIRQCADPRVRLIERPQRRGKMATLNELVLAARNNIIVFCDARQAFAASTVKELAANFSDPTVGCVSGELIFREKEGEGATAKGVGLYWNYEKFIRKEESRVHSMLGATGAIYAIRRELFVQIPEYVVLDDMYVPLQIIRKGYRAVFDETPKAYDRVADSPREEYRRKTRTLFGNYQIFKLFPDLLNPLRSPVAVQLFSHKLLRLFVPFFMIAVFILNGMIGGAVPPQHAPVQAFYQLLFRLQVIFYVLGCTGALSRHQKRGILKVVSRVCYIPYVFCLLNFSALIGFLRFVGAKQEATWEKART